MSLFDAIYLAKIINEHNLSPNRETDGKKELLTQARLDGMITGAIRKVTGEYIYDMGDHLYDN